MVGPRISFHIGGMRIAIGAIDLLLAALILFGVLRERLEPAPAPAFVAVGGLALCALCFAVTFLSEKLRLRLARTGPPALPLTVSLPAAYGPNVSEARSSVSAARAGIAGMGVDLAIGLIAVTVYLLVDTSDRQLGDLAAVAAIAIGGSAGLRFLAAPSLNGGRVMRWMLGFTLDDDEDALRATRLIGFGVAVLLFVSGVLLVASEGEAGFWGVGVAAIGIDLGVLATLATQQTFWLRTAGSRMVGDLLEAPHAVVTASNPLGEMVSVLAVDGPAAIAVVRDANGNAVGIMQFQQMRAGVGPRKEQLTIEDVMIPLDALPEVSREATLLETANLLLQTGRPAVRFQNDHHKWSILTARDIGLPR